MQDQAPGDSGSLRPWTLAIHHWREELEPEFDHIRNVITSEYHPKTRTRFVGWSYPCPSGSNVVRVTVYEGPGGANGCRRSTAT